MKLIGYATGRLTVGLDDATKPKTQRHQRLMQAAPLPLPSTRQGCAWSLSNRCGRPSFGVTLENLSSSSILVEPLARLARLEGLE